MLSRGTWAGIVGLLSLLVPCEIYLFSNSFMVSWTVGFLDCYGSPTSCLSVGLTQLGGDTIDLVLLALTLVFILTGSILLLTHRGSLRLGATSLALGLILNVSEFYVYDIYQGDGNPLPLGAVLMVVACVLGFTGPSRPRPLAANEQTVSPTEHLARLKALLDSGVVTREEYEEMKKRILASPPAGRFCFNCGALLVGATQFCPECGSKQPLIQLQPAPITATQGSRPLTSGDVGSIRSRMKNEQRVGISWWLLCVIVPLAGGLIAVWKWHRKAPATANALSSIMLLEVMVDAVGSLAIGLPILVLSWIIGLAMMVYFRGQISNVQPYGIAQPSAQVPVTAEPKTRTCPNCGSIVHSGEDFCPHCGTKQLEPQPHFTPTPQAHPAPAARPRFCPNCGAPLSGSTRFCSQCGAQLP